MGLPDNSSDGTETGGNIWYISFEVSGSGKYQSATGGPLTLTLTNGAANMSLNIDFLVLPNMPRNKRRLIFSKWLSCRNLDRC